MSTPIRIIVDGETFGAELNDSPTATAIADALPLEASASRWGDELYFSTPINKEAEDDARADFDVGELGYWPPGNAFCIFFGPTPMSHGLRPVMANPGNPIGHITEDGDRLLDASSGARVRVELA
ncbi:MAG: hypothetical protein CMJ78_26130 [Planctomycetaceae bacterium]|nr:hypothetical protein [Planctomycetaceae bacterium]